MRVLTPLYFSIVQVRKSEKHTCAHAFVSTVTRRNKMKDETCNGSPHSARREIWNARRFWRQLTHFIDYQNVYSRCWCRLHSKERVAATQVFLPHPSLLSVWCFFVLFCFHTAHSLNHYTNQMHTSSDSTPLSFSLSDQHVLIARYPVDLCVEWPLLDGLAVLNLAWLYSFWCFDRSNKI